MSAPVTPPGGRGLDPRWPVAAVLLVALLAAIALMRGGLLGLPSAPAGVTAQSAGLANLDTLGRRARLLEEPSPGSAPSDSALGLAAGGLRAISLGDVAGGLGQLRRAVRGAPEDLVIGNAYRMAVLRLRRAALANAARASLAATTPPELAGQPIAFLDSVSTEHPCREASLQLALAWVDELMLFPALEIKAPASVRSVTQLSGILATHPAYVPALFGRGLNYLYRPARLMWPEARKAATDAATHDFGLSVAIGRKVGGAPPRLVATLALTLGDAYAKEGSPQRARSWWQIAGNASADPELHAAIARRFAWQDAEMLERLEAELDARMLDLDHPLTDLSLMWR